MEKNHALMIVWPFAGCNYNKSNSSDGRVDVFPALFDLADPGLSLQQRDHVLPEQILSAHPSYVLPKSVNWSFDRRRLGGNATLRMWGESLYYPANSVISDFYLQIASNVNQQIRNIVMDFDQQHGLSASELITVHARQGNGEKRDFVRKGRNNPVHDLVTVINDQIESVINSPQLNRHGRNWKVFVATDNVNVVEMLRNITDIEVISRERHGLDSVPGTGVLFEAAVGPECVTAEMDKVVDQMLLSMGRVLLIPVYSSFNRLPQVLVGANQGIVCGTVKGGPYREHVVTKPVWRCTDGTNATIEI